MGRKQAEEKTSGIQTNLVISGKKVYEGQFALIIFQRTGITFIKIIKGWFVCTRIQPHRKQQHSHFNCSSRPTGRKDKQSSGKQIRTSRLLSSGLNHSELSGRTRWHCPAEARVFPGGVAAPWSIKPPKSRPSYLLCKSVSWHKFSIAWISSRIRQPGLRKRQECDGLA